MIWANVHCATWDAQMSTLYVTAGRQKRIIIEGGLGGKLKRILSDSGKSATKALAFVDRHWPTVAQMVILQAGVILQRYLIAASFPETRHHSYVPCLSLPCLPSLCLTLVPTYSRSYPSVPSEDRYLICSRQSS